MAMRIATCIGCGCTDNRACISEGSGDPCHWLAVDYMAGKGVCSECGDHLTRYHAGDHRVMAPMIVAKITRDGDEKSEPFYFEMADMVSFPAYMGTTPGDKFIVEWVEMSTADFEALPQFSSYTMTERWLQAVEAANAAAMQGDDDEHADKRQMANNIEAELKAKGVDVRALAVELFDADQNDFPPQA